MRPEHRLETPPPSSHFRRPWSPKPFDPNPRLSFDDITRSARQEGLQHQRREGSEYSVEALDLADYANILVRQGNTHAQLQPVFQLYSSYPPSPQPFHALSSRASTSTPLLLSPSMSASLTHSESPRSSTSPRAAHRPFSFPTPAFTSDHSGYSPPSRRNVMHDRDVLRTPPPEPDHEIDIAQFPAFTRGWYSKPKVGNEPLSQYAPFQVDPFDPSFPSHEFGGYSTPPPLYKSLNASSIASQSNRNVVPWGTDALGGEPVDASIKEERIRMLEREFAGKNAVLQDDEELLVGSVDSKGRLITEGPKKRTLVRWLQVLLALTAAGSGIYTAVTIKTSPPPPPANKPPAYILYVFSVLTFLLSAYLFILYPSCCGARRRKPSGPQFTGGPAGMMVLPVQALSGDKKKKGKKNVKEGDGVQVNLIVDPSMFNRGLGEDDADETSEPEYTIPGSYSTRSLRSRRRRAVRRRSIFAGLAMEEQWKYARKMLKWGMAVDVLMFFAWGAEFLYILIGKRCPSGSFNGWCDGYNLATAAACLLCLAFGTNIFFDIKDLHASSMSPRTRARV